MFQFHITDLYQGYWYYVLFLSAVMVFTGYINDYNISYKIHEKLIHKIKNTKLLLVIISMVSGILPIPGRVIASAGLLDSLIGKNTPWRKDFGILNYISTHHYYLWSPIEKSVILPMGALGLSYFQFMGYIWPLLAISFALLLGFLWLGFPNISHENIVLPNKNEIPQKIPNPIKYLNFKMLGFITSVFIITNILRNNSHMLIDIFMGYNFANLFIVSVTSFILSFILGSSGRFAGIVAGLTTIYGIEYFVLFFAIQYSGYLISPAHRCNFITLTYFNTNIKKYVAILLLWCILNISYGVLTLI